MRKYYQAALAVIAVISLISLLIYRHEYNKLRYVLEVFNYFGKPGPRIADANCTNISAVFTTFNAKFDEPIPSWQRLEDDLYIYSAYSINDKEIRAIGLGTINGVSNMQCLVFFESENKPILGSFGFIPIGNAVASSLGENSRYGGYHFVCTYTSDEMPTGITFVTRSNKYLNYAPIFPIKIQRQGGSSSRIGVCVTQSSMKPAKSIDMIGFISFHALIGMDNFIIYDSGISNEFNSRLKEMASDPTSFWKFTYTVVPWNFPFTEIDQNVIKEIIEMDCLYRTYNSVAYAIALSWNEYINLKYHHAMIDLLADFKQFKLTADRYELKIMTFCTQQTDNKQYANSTLMILKKTKTDVNSPEDRVIYIHEPQVTLQNSHLSVKEVGKDLIAVNQHKYFHSYVKEVGKHLIAVNQYKYCDNYRESREVEDLTILRFVQDIQNSSILKKYLGSYNVLDIDIK
ncbi:uncharacterized protein LOC105836951 [Monomorium pharaonis]|uniref:uncharacterized protein LOC105836951 n=1 Tax=Monomorium pharaonis TaxID=307658 RepID=UPI00063F872F|nr:uncharacterized protein LOC105836951 [Monomorium pharaonis]XP_012536817.1 uncharacterized protein LOC105836951 [Monomorium pharaonis]XP_012536825.1 uncharacterized protein LOC105836951 [Monomorium pharaonis]XP_036138264.1 uncharacterized protein LOC105836951 [Monomorium pharaonis]